jgi:Tfp pilus assembly protein PilN
MKQEKIKELEEKIKMLEEKNAFLSQQKSELEDEILEIKETKRVPILTLKDKEKLQERYYEARYGEKWKKAANEGF